MAKKMDLTDMLKAGYISQDEYNRIVEKTDPSKPKRAEVVADYQRYLIEKGYAERIAQHYSSAVNSFLEWLRDFSAERGITIETWNDININYVNAYLFSLVAKDVKKTYLDKQSRGLTQFFEKLKNDRLTDVNSKDILISSLLMPDNSGTNALTNDEIERIMAANDYKGKVLILLAYECMLKANEICRVCFSDFDLENKILTVYGNDDRTQIKKTIENQ